MCILSLLAGRCVTFLASMDIISSVSSVLSSKQNTYLGNKIQHRLQKL